jgi:hypothetical protein
MSRTPEGALVTYFRKRVKRIGGVTRKCVWSSHVGAPDQFVMLPRIGAHFWVELKAPGKKPRRVQFIEQRLMSQAGCSVFVCDSRESVDRLLSSFVSLEDYGDGLL